MQRLKAVAATKHARYCAVSANGVLVTQVLLTLFVHGLGRGAVAANLGAVSISCVPSFLLNRSWVWQASGRDGMWRQGLAFWGMALVGLALSTATVALLADAWDSPIVANVGNALGFGVLWVVKFFVLDRVLFRSLPQRAPAAAVP